MILAIFSICIGIILYFIYGLFNIQFNLFIPSINKIITSEKIVFLTFDDSPHPIHTPKILEILDANNVKATFFSIGKNISKYPEVFQQIVNNGHSIGNHSYCHNVRFTFRSAEKVLKELLLCDSKIHSFTDKPIKFFRPPFGITNPSIAKALKQTEYKSIGWSIRSFDTILTKKNYLINRVINKLTPGAIILLHDSGKCTINALPEIIEQIKKRGYRIDNLVNFV